MGIGDIPLFDPQAQRQAALLQAAGSFFGGDYGAGAFGQGIGALGAAQAQMLQQQMRASIAQQEMAERERRNAAYEQGILSNDAYRKSLIEAQEGRTAASDAQSQAAMAAAQASVDAFVEQYPDEAGKLAFFPDMESKLRYIQSVVTPPPEKQASKSNPLTQSAAESDISGLFTRLDREAGKRRDVATGASKIKRFTPPLESGITVAEPADPADYQREVEELRREAAATAAEIREWAKTQENPELASIQALNELQRRLEERLRQIAGTEVPDLDTELLYGE